jgi:hypothetical protein
MMLNNPVRLHIDLQAFALFVLSYYADLTAAAWYCAGVNVWGAVFEPKRKNRGADAQTRKNARIRFQQVPSSSAIIPETRPENRRVGVPDATPD